MTGNSRNMGRCLNSQAAVVLLMGLCLASCVIAAATAHPLGNFTVNQYARITVGTDRTTIRYVIDMAEISTLQELQKIETAGDGPPSAAELDRHLERIAAEYLGGLVVKVGEARLPLRIGAKTIGLTPGAGGLPTLRVLMDLAASLPAAMDSGGARRRFSFEDTNRRERLGWREIVVEPTDEVSVFDGNAHADGLTDELKAYPQETLAAPLREEAASFFFRQGPVPPGAAALRKRDGHHVGQARDRLAELIDVPEVTPLIALFGLLLAAGLGALHAFSPGHGKTVVGAYLVGSRASLKHAVFLGLTVTVTHTLGVVALGLVTLFASHYVLPEQLFPVLGFVSGATVVVIGLGLFAARLRGALSPVRRAHMHAHEHAHDGRPALVHSHGGREHSHLPPGADGKPVGWRSLLALGISGGLLPCPSALVVLLSAISLHREGYGLALVVAFSLGLAATLTGLGIAVLYAGRWMKRPTNPALQRILRLLPMTSAIVIAILGAGICYEALSQSDFEIPGKLAGLFAQRVGDLPGEVAVLAFAGVIFLLGLWLVFKASTAFVAHGHPHGFHSHSHGNRTGRGHAHVHPHHHQHHEHGLHDHHGHDHHGHGHRERDHSRASDGGANRDQVHAHAHKAAHNRARDPAPVIDDNSILKRPPVT